MHVSIHVYLFVAYQILWYHTLRVKPTIGRQVVCLSVTKQASADGYAMAGDGYKRFETRKMLGYPPGNYCNISRPGKRKIMFKSALGGDMLVYRMAKLPCLLQFHGFLWGCVSSVQNLKDTNSLAVVFGTNWCVEDWLVNFSGVKSLVKNFQFASFIPVLIVYFIKIEAARFITCY